MQKFLCYGTLWKSPSRFCQNPRSLRPSLHQHSHMLWGFHPRVLVRVIISSFPRIPYESYKDFISCLISSKPSSEEYFVVSFLEWILSPYVIQTRRPGCVWCSNPVIPRLCRVAVRPRSRFQVQVAGSPFYLFFSCWFYNTVGLFFVSGCVWIF